MMRLNRFLPAFLMASYVGSVSPGTTIGQPSQYVIIYEDTRYFQAGQEVAFEWTITTKSGGNVPAPTALSVSLLDANKNALTPPVTSSPTFDDSAGAAASKVLSGILTLPTPDALSQVYYVQLLVSFNDGTGVQTIPYLTLIRILA